MTSSIWAQRALEHARRISEIAPGRGSATRAEWQAAQEVQAQLHRIGIHQVTVQEFTGQRSLWLFLGLAFGLALVGHAAFWLLSSLFGAYPTLALSSGFFLLSGSMLWRKFTFKDHPLQAALPAGPSQNILATIQPAGTVRRRVVLLSHLDSHRAVWLFATDFLVSIFAFISPAAVYGVILAPGLYLLADLSGLRFCAYLALILAGLHFLAWFTGMTADLGPYSPGANDNASAVGSLLSLGERLVQQPLQHTEIWLAFTGCEETGGGGFHRLLAEYASQLRDALFLDFELVGIGEQLSYLQDEGLVRKQHISADVERLVLEAGAEWGIRPLRAARFGAFTEAGAAWEAGLRAVCILVQPKNGRLMPEWHRLTDRVERLQAGALEKAHAFAWALLQKLDMD